MVDIEKKGRSYQFTFADGTTFTKQKDLLDFVKDTKEQHPVMVPFENQAFWRDYFSMHPRADEKIVEAGGEPYKVAVGVGDGPGKRNLCIIGPQQVIYFSWSYPAESTRGRRDKQHTLDAMRSEINPQIFDFKRAYFDGSDMAYSAFGTLVTFDACEIDHYPIPFTELRDGFLAQEGITLLDIKFQEDPTDYRHQQMVDRALAQRWQLYHKTHMTLRVLSIEEHRKATHG